MSPGWTKEVKQPRKRRNNNRNYKIQLTETKTVGLCYNDVHGEDGEHEVSEMAVGK